jgi:hypothetical protein
MLLSVELISNQIVGIPSVWGRAGRDEGHQKYIITQACEAYFSYEGVMDVMGQGVQFWDKNDLPFVILLCFCFFSFLIY